MPGVRTVGFVAEAEIGALERKCPSGVTSAQVIGFFRERGVKLSEATFRRYVQLDLLPRCRRVGRKGRHLGSEGIYPVGVVRRLNDVKRRLDAGHTIEDVRAMFRISEDDLETVRARVARMVAVAEEHLEREPDDVLRREVAGLREAGRQVEAAMRAVRDHFARRGERSGMAV